ncbi:hypothetical protein [Enterobacter cloacae complex sp. ECNIH14]|uniref:hypothetical protein n=1 Tax=Enterobacter cloacae complex sp. ECNIH14 TaxID=2080664 RepID=UPI000CDE0105|nr:hypothetical protein [Enterobacter cloacae complex sp. ECNIH14]POU00048.1 hypothetical protein C3399_03870 [Enterobacter cloacae complex sp. ECNIH14]
MSHVTIEQVRERLTYLEDLNARGVGSKVSSQQFEIACLRKLLASLEAERNAENVSDAELNAALQVHKLKIDGHSQLSDAFRAGFIYARRTASPAPVSIPDEWRQWIADAVEYLEGGLEADGELEAEGSIEAKRLLSRRAAMLQGAEPATTNYKLPDDFDFDRFNDVVWLEAVASNPHMHSPTTSTIAMVALELNRKLADGNSPMIPYGWIMVPIEPTEKMVIEGFESEPDEFFSKTEVWDAYQKMSGCEQAAHRAKLCWAAMITAAPKQEVEL